MGLFAPKTDTHQHPELVECIEKLRGELAEVRNDIAAQASAFRLLETEWLNTHDKLKRIMGRLAKRDAVDNERPSDVREVPEVPEPDDGLDPITRKILARRNKRRA